MGKFELTFSVSDRYFYLRTLSGLDALPVDVWEAVDLHTLRTSNLKAAAAFRPHADETCERVFNRAFNKAYEAPRLPQLSFLDPHQREGVEWILTRARSYLAHAPGAGKTAQAVVASCLIKAPGQTVFVVPPSLTENWEREIWAFTREFKAFPTVGIVQTTANRHATAWRADFVIVPDSMLATPWVYDRLHKMRIKLLAVDEASRFKESTSTRSLAFYGGKSKYRFYPGLFQNARHVVLLDGSPMPNGRGMELWAPTFALDPEAIDCMSQRDYGLKFCGPTMNNRGQYEFKHLSNELELRRRLRQRFMHVVTEDQLSHPERRRSILFMNKDVRTPDIKNWERKNLNKLKLEELSEETSQGEIATIRKELGLLKVPWIARYIQDRIQMKAESILLFVWHRDVAIALRNQIAYSALVIGGTPAAEREKTFEQFQ